DPALVFAMGAAVLEHVPGKIAADARAAFVDGSLSPAQRLKVASDRRLTAQLGRPPVRSLETESDEILLIVETARAAVGAWYEFFPRSEGAQRRKDGSWKSGTFRTAAGRLPAVAAMGFDVVYLPPIHPIGVSHRKGPNNS